MTSRPSYICGCGLGPGGRNLTRRQQGLPDATRKWPVGFVFRWQLYGTIRGFDQATMENTITRGFNQWSSISSFKFEKAQSQGDANVHISVVGPGQTDEGLPYMGPNQWRYGYGILGPQGYDGQLFGTFKFNDSETGPPSWDLTTMYNTFVHEFGHVIGVGHVDPPQALMAWQMYDPTREMQLTDVDIDRFRRFYGDPAYFSGGGQNTNNNNNNNQGQNLNQGQFPNQGQNFNQQDPNYNQNYNQQYPTYNQNYNQQYQNYNQQYQNYYPYQNYKRKMKREVEKTRG
ncbi:hypothetical protein TWF281_011399 [Arthrobotrys megalospora]